TVERSGRKGAPKGNGQQSEYSLARARRENALALKTELESARLKGELVTVESVLRGIRDAFTAIKGNAELLPYRVTVKLMAKFGVAYRAVSPSPKRLSTTS